MVSNVSLFKKHFAKMLVLLYSPDRVTEEEVCLQDYCVRVPLTLHVSLPPPLPIVGLTSDVSERAAGSFKAICHVAGT